MVASVHAGLAEGLGKAARTCDPAMIAVHVEIAKTKGILSFMDTCVQLGHIEQAREMVVQDMAMIGCVRRVDSDCVQGGARSDGGRSAAPLSLSLWG